MATCLVATPELTERFIRGLANHRLTYEDIIKSGWRYCGGDTGHHANYWDLTNVSAEQPYHHDNCVCSHHIYENCYICNREGTRILVLGNCCIKKFMPKDKSGRTCSECGKPHRNRVVDRCNECRRNRCDECGVYFRAGNKKKCDTCRLSSMRGKEVWKECPCKCGGSRFVLTAKKYPSVDICERCYTDES